uniref:BGL04 n=1 Tax=Arundo donax TaxID=35708 RepID=A0A0A8YR72_ARUDO
MQMWSAFTEKNIRFLDPIIHGDYPREMHKMLGPNLPEFTSKEKKLLQATKLDFIGINHYTSLYLKDCIFSPCELDRFDGDARIGTSAERDGVLLDQKIINICC